MKSDAATVGGVYFGVERGASGGGFDGAGDGAGESSFGVRRGDGLRDDRLRGASFRLSQDVQRASADVRGDCVGEELRVGASDEHLRQPGYAAVVCGGLQGDGGSG